MYQRRLCIAPFIFLVTLSASGQVNILDSVHWNIGTSFTTSSGYGSGFSTWVSPSISYPVGKKVHLFGGVSLTNTTLIGFKPWYSETEVSGWSGNLTSLFIYGGGQYSITPRLQLSGTVWKQLPLLQEAFPGSTKTSILAPDGQGIDLYLNYRIGKSVTIGAGFQYSQGNSLFNQDPFISTPFQHNDFIPAGPYGW